jgi:hypothetical protein
VFLFLLCVSVGENSRSPGSAALLIVCAGRDGRSGKLPCRAACAHRRRRPCLPQDPRDATTVLQVQR